MTTSPSLNHNESMQLALDWARRGQRCGEVPVGAVITCPTHGIVGAAHNQTFTLPDATAHAEVMAIQQACRRLGTARLIDCSLYVTLEPCAMCAGAIVQARLKQVIFAAYDPKMGAIEHGVRLFDQPGCNHAPAVIGGIAKSEAAQLLQAFFAGQRQAIA